MITLPFEIVVVVVVVVVVDVVDEVLVVSEIELFSVCTVGKILTLCIYHRGRER